VEARTPALDDQVASARAPRAWAARAQRLVALSGRVQLPLLGSLHHPQSYSEGGGGGVGRLEQKFWMVELGDGRRAKFPGCRWRPGQ
jgi:hypothetical protein